MKSHAQTAPDCVSLEVRIRGRVQGVGFRPNAWRIARDLGVAGEVLNDGEGVLVRVDGDAESVRTFVHRLRDEPPPLGRVDTIETRPYAGDLPDDFRIVDSLPGVARTQIAPDAAICETCASEIASPVARRFRYAFANCTHCGPRLSIVKGIPYDRATTTMAPFRFCFDCAREYEDPADRRFHAEATACPACGPRVRLIRFDGTAVSIEARSMLDDIDAATELLRYGEIVAIKGLGGYQLACDATNATAVARLRANKRRDAKPFALMARDLDVVRRYCTVNAEEERVLRSAAAPIVLLSASGFGLPKAIAPGLSTFGFMLPTTPLHAIILERMACPLVMTSGNISDEPQVVEDADARRHLAAITPYALVHDRAIANRVDDSVVRVVAGRSRLIRRARGFAPAPIRLPAGFDDAPDTVAYGGELKSTFCLVKDGEAVLSQHQGDLEDVATLDDFRRNLALYTNLFDHSPIALVADRHPEYVASKIARSAAARGLPLIEVQHHHAHVAACLAENGRPLAAAPVLGIVLDGLGFGDDDTIWGGEFLLADYQAYERLGTFKPVAMLGGERAVREPWRNLYAHLLAGMGWEELAIRFPGLEIVADLAARPRAMLDAMLRSGTNAPLASSCGRLFDAFAAALDVCRERQAYEGQAAATLEAMVDRQTLQYEDESLAYPFVIANLESGLPFVEPREVWRATLRDLACGTKPGIMAARFHKGLAKAVVEMASRLARGGTEIARFDTVALSGGCFQNCVLFEQVVRRLEANGFTVLTHAEVPTNDGGLALGQAAIGSARLIAHRQIGGPYPCALGFPARS